MAEAIIKDIFLEGFRPADFSPDTSNNTVVEIIVATLLEAGVPFNELVGAKSLFRIKRSYDTSTVLVSIDTTNGIVIDTGAGTLTLTFNVGHFSAFRFNDEEQEFVYDWDLVDSTDRLWRLFKGDFAFGGDV